MKLTRRVLAVIISAAMLFGMVVVGASAATATSLTTYGAYDAQTNPYQVKLGLKAFRTDDSGAYVEITDGKVLPGEVVRIEVWGQTNYHTMTASLVTAYSNTLFAATKLDGTTYTYTEGPGAASEVVEAVAFDEAAADEALNNEGELGASYDFPYEFNAVAKINTLFAGSSNATALTQVYNNTGVSSSAYNLVNVGYGPDIDLSLPSYLNWGQSRCGVITSYQPLFYYNLTVAGDVNATGSVQIPESAVRSSTNTSGKMYVSASVPNALCMSNNGFEDDAAVADFLATYQTIAAAECDQIMYSDTYADGTKADRVVDLTEGTINFTVVSSLEEEEPVEADKTALKAAIDTLPAYTQDEADETTWANYVAALATANEVYADTAASQDAVNDAAENLLAAIAAVTAKPVVAPELVALGNTIIDEENGFIYGLDHADNQAIYDLVEDGYVEVEGDGSVVCTPVGDNSNLGSGATVELLDSTGAVVKTYYVVVFGDNDGNGYVNLDDTTDFTYYDAMLIEDEEDIKYYYDDPSEMSKAAVFAMDLNADGSITGDDMTYIFYWDAMLLDDIYQAYDGTQPEPMI